MEQRKMIANSILELINDYPWGLTPNGAWVEFPSQEEARLAVKLFFQDWAASAKNINGMIKICGGNRKIYEISKFMDDEIGDYMSDLTLEVANMLWFGKIPVTPALFRLAADLIENPRRAGIVRIPDERQIILTNESGYSLKNASLEEAVTWTRENYWHPQDLQEFRQRCRQELSAEGESYIEHTYRAFDPTLGATNPTFGNWVRLTQRYRLFDGNDGNFYQLFEALDMEQLELQTIGS